jgi:hypothetical protein
LTTLNSNQVASFARQSQRFGELQQQRQGLERAGRSLTNGRPALSLSNAPASPGSRANFGNPRSSALPAPQAKTSMPKENLGSSSSSGVASPGTHNGFNHTMTRTAPLQSQTRPAQIFSTPSTQSVSPSTRATTPPTPLRGRRCRKSRAIRRPLSKRRRVIGRRRQYDRLLRAPQSTKRRPIIPLRLLSQRQERPPCPTSMPRRLITRRPVLTLLQPSIPQRPAFMRRRPEEMEAVDQPTAVGISTNGSSIGERGAKAPPCIWQRIHGGLSPPSPSTFSMFLQSQHSAGGDGGLCFDLGRR